MLNISRPIAASRRFVNVCVPAKDELKKKVKKKRREKRRLPASSEQKGPDPTKMTFGGIDLDIFNKYQTYTRSAT